MLDLESLIITSKFDTRKMGIMNLLLIDDDEDDVLFFSEAICEINLGARLTHYASGQSALNDMGTGKLPKQDLIFIDINMPAINGWECLRQIKKMAEWQRIPIVMYSTANLEGTGVRPVDVGAVAFYQKSDSFAELKRRLNEVIVSVLTIR